MAASSRKEETGLTTKEHRFIEVYSSNGNQQRSYAKAFGYKKPEHWMTVNASRILARPEAKEKLRALHAKSEAGALVDHTKLVLMYLEAYQMAKRDRDMAAMISATAKIAELGGFVGRDGEGPQRQKDRVELMREIEERQRRLGLRMIDAERVA
jgi:hypothetical protein